MEGFIILDYVPYFSAARAHIAQLMRTTRADSPDDNLKKEGWEAKVMGGRRFTLVEGVERAPEALGMLFEGGNVGKM